MGVCVGHLEEITIQKYTFVAVFKATDIPYGIFPESDPSGKEPMEDILKWGSPFKTK